MPASTEFGRSLGGTMSERIVRKLPLERLPRHDRPLALEAIEAEVARERAENEKRRAAVERVAEEYRRAVHDLVGEKKARGLSAAARRERAALRVLSRTPGLASRELERAVRRTQAPGRRARELGVDFSRLRKLGEARGRRIARLSEPPAAAVTTGRLLESVVGRVGKGGGRPHLIPPDATVTPPFVIGLMYHNSDASEGFSVGYDWEIDEISGRVTARTWMRCPDADWQNDYAAVWVDAAQVFQYTAPRTGPLSVIVEATNLEGRSQVALIDEFGFSGSHTHLRNYMTLRVYHPSTPGVSFAEMSHLEHSWDERNGRREQLLPGLDLLGDASLERGGPGRRHILRRGRHAQLRFLDHRRRRSRDHLGLQLGDSLARAPDSRRRTGDPERRLADRYRKARKAPEATHRGAEKALDAFDREGEVLPSTGALGEPVGPPASHSTASVSPAIQSRCAVDRAARAPAPAR